MQPMTNHIIMREGMDEDLPHSECCSHESAVDGHVIIDIEDGTCREGLFITQAEPVRQLVLRIPTKFDDGPTKNVITDKVNRE